MSLKKNFISKKVLLLLSLTLVTVSVVNCNSPVSGLHKEIVGSPQTLAQKQLIQAKSSLAGSWICQGNSCAAEETIFISADLKSYNTFYSQSLTNGKTCSVEQDSVMTVGNISSNSSSLLTIGSTLAVGQLQLVAANESDPDCEAAAVADNKANSANSNIKSLTIEYSSKSQELSVTENGSDGFAGNTKVYVKMSGESLPITQSVGAAAQALDWMSP